jgi:hypothetical protein
LYFQAGIRTGEIEGTQMAKDVINVDGEDRVVREDTAKSYRGVIWILTVLAIVIIGAAVLFLGGFLGSGGKIDSPANIENSSRK